MSILKLLTMVFLTHYLDAITNRHFTIAIPFLEGKMSLYSDF